jgi:hypothetical protein
MSSSEYICDFCEKEFSNKTNLTVHQKNAKYCLQIQGRINQQYKCGHCEKIFSSQQQITKHKECCKIKQQSEKDNWQIEIKKQYEYLLTKKDEECKQLLFEKEEHCDTQMNVQKKYYEQLLNSKDEYIAKLESRIEKFEDVVIYQSNKVTTTTNHHTNNNIVVNTNNTLNLNDKDAISAIIDEKLTENHVCNGQRGLAKFAFDNLLTDENGNLKYKCVDSSRQNFEFTNINGIIERDVKASKLKQALLDSNVVRQAVVVGEKVWTRADGTVDIERFDVFNGKALEIMTVDKDDTKFRSELSILTSE